MWNIETINAGQSGFDAALRGITKKANLLCEQGDDFFEIKEGPKDVRQITFGKDNLPTQVTTYTGHDFGMGLALAEEAGWYHCAW